MNLIDDLDESTCYDCGQLVQAARGGGWFHVSLNDVAHCPGMGTVRAVADAPEDWEAPEDDGDWLSDEFADAASDYLRWPATVPPF
jgi:hypothetical protein